MQLKLFTDLIAALGKVASGLKAIANLPKAERAKYRQVLDDTYRLIDTTLNMVIIRLGDIQASDSADQFVQEVKKLGNYGDWLQAEREFRLCKSLRAAVRETETLLGQLTGALSTTDWDALLDQMRGIFATEGEVAYFVSENFRELAHSAEVWTGGMPEFKDIEANTAALRNALIKERQELISQEIELYSLV